MGGTPEKFEEAEPDVAEIELEEGIDDPVRMYLREIGKVSLLTADDEKRLARSMEEGEYVQQLEEAHYQETGRYARGVDVLARVMRDLHTLKKPIEFIQKDLGLQKSTPVELVANEAFRKIVDGELDLPTIEKLQAGLKIEQEEAERFSWSGSRSHARPKAGVDRLGAGGDGLAEEARRASGGPRRQAVSPRE